MKKTKVFLLLFIIIVLTSRNYATDTNLPNIILPSPNAQTFAKYGEYPVSYYTGVPDIKIPLYSIDLKDISIPISISYNASGIRVDEESGRTGLGWTLDVGGVITHTIMGRYNDFTNDVYFHKPPTNNLTDLKGIYNFTKYTIGSYSAIVPFTIPVMSKYDLMCGLSGDNVNCGGVELAPDVFNYNFMGYSGKFIFSRNGDIIKEKEDNLVITPSILDGTEKREIVSWIITTPDGTSYFFNQTEQAQADYSTFSKYNCSFYLTKVQTIKNTEVNFEYKKQGNLYNIYNRIQDNKLNIDVSFTNTNYEVIYLSKIIYPGGFVDFNYIFDREDYSPEPKLNKIYIAEESTYWNFEYDNFIANVTQHEFPTLTRIQQIIGSNANFYTSAWNNKRLKLKGIYQNDINNNVTNKYQFLYNEKILPTKLSASIDHWGYDNGANNYTLVPSFYQNISQNVGEVTIGGGGGLSSNRDPSAYYNQSFMLNQIVYPTGGKTIFSYETNDYKTSIMENDPHKIDFMYSVEKTTLNDASKYAPIDYVQTKSFDIPSIGEQNYINIVVKIVLSDTYVTDLTYLNPALKMTIQNNISNNSIWSYTYQAEELPTRAAYNSNNKTLERNWQNIKIDPGSFNINITGSLRKYIESTTIDVIRIVYPAEYLLKNPIALGGGLRIKEISSYDANGGRLIGKRYEYIGDDSKTSGKLMFYPRYTKDYNTIGSNGLRGSGYSVGYSQVHVFDLDKDGIEFAKTIYDFINFPDKNLYYTWQLTENQGTFKVKDENPSGIAGYKFSENGTLLNSCSFIKRDGQYKKIKKSKFDYSFLGGGPLIYWGVLKSSQIPIGYSNCLQTYLISFLENIPALDMASGYIYPAIRPMQIYLNQQTDTLFDGGGIETIKNYSYNFDYHYVTNETQISSENINHIVEYKYPFDFKGTKEMDDLVKKNIISSPVEITNKTENNITTQIVKKYDYYSNRLNIPQLSEIQSNTGSNRILESRVKYLNYDNNGNPAYISKDDATKIVYIWSYNYQYPIAEIKNATYDDVVNNLGISIDNLANATLPDMTKVDGIRAKLPNAMVTTYTYNPLVGISTLTDPRGIITFFEYDSFNRLKQTSIIENGEKKILKKYDYHYQNQ